MKLPPARAFHFDIDEYLNPIIPPSQLHRLPTPISRFLGYRRTPPTPIGNLIVALWGLIGTFCGLTAVTAVYKFSPVIERDHPPVIIASLGAAAILTYNTISSPLAQPRSSIFGHTLAALVGVAITKLIALAPTTHITPSHTLPLAWLAGPLACAAAAVAMTLTNSVYPPGGATAVLAATDAQVVALGWEFVPLVLLGSTVMLGVALVWNNLCRVYPVFWWTPGDVGGMVWGKGRGADVEEAGGGREGKAEYGELGEALGNRIVITEGRLWVPEGFPLGYEQREVLEVLRDRLRGWEREGSEAGSETTARSDGSGGGGHDGGMKKERQHREH